MRTIEGVSATCLAASSSVIAGGMNGHVYVLAVGGAIQRSTQVFKKPIRNIVITYDNHILCSSSNGFVACVDLASLELMWRVKTASAAISALCFLANCNQVAIGTDLGDLIVIDKDDPQREIHKSDPHDDFISGIVYNEAKKTLVTASGDGHIAVFDARRNFKEVARSEGLEDEMLCMRLLHSGSRIWVGTGIGVINIFNWGYFGVPSQRIKGLKDGEVNTISHLQENQALVGTSSGAIRLIEKEKPVARITLDHSIESIVTFDGWVFHLDPNGIIRVWPLTDITQSSAPRQEDIDRQSFLDGFAQ